MSRNQRPKKEAKKKPQHTAKEKKAAKRDKKHEATHASLLSKN